MGLVVDNAQRAPMIERGEVDRIGAELVFWDAWPIQDPSGAPISRGGSQLWMALAAPASLSPSERHHHARIHLVLRDGYKWQDFGPAMPDGFSPGSREWSGSAVAWNEQQITLYFTAAGRRGESAITFEQRLFAADAVLEAGTCTLKRWDHLREVVKRDPAHYMDPLAGPEAPGKIKGFRDPGFFRDPVTHADYLLFTGSLAGSNFEHNGVIGVARADANSNGGWTCLPPLVSADGLNNELERPHVLHRDGLYYLFWSTQRSVFAPGGRIGPTGLYGMVSRSLLEGWEPMNGTGLVLANPEQAPSQAYSWLVLPDLSVTSFVDEWEAEGSGGFGGTFAPFVQLRLEGSRSWLVAGHNG
jgi:levansucrase